MFGESYGYKDLMYEYAQESHETKKAIINHFFEEALEYIKELNKSRKFDSSQDYVKSMYMYINDIQFKSANPLTVLENHLKVNNDTIKISELIETRVKKVTYIELNLIDQDGCDLRTMRIDFSSGLAITI